MVPVNPPHLTGLPRIVEVKRKLSGRETRFNCAVLQRTAAHIVVLFVASAAMHVHGVDLPTGTVTFGHFWNDRPYNVYHWLDPSTGVTIGIYVNVSDRTRIGDDVLEWRDLDVDVMLMPDGRVTVLDEHEIPADVPFALRSYIEEAKASIMRAQGSLTAELERQRVTFWPPPGFAAEPPP